LEYLQHHVKVDDTWTHVNSEMQSDVQEKKRLTQILQPDSNFRTTVQELPIAQVLQKIQQEKEKLLLDFD
jgi:hypothetical protein